MLFLVVAATALVIRHEWFFFTSDGVISPKTAVSLGLIGENDAPWVGGLVFKRANEGGYDFREGHVTHFAGRTRHTEVDMFAACIKAGECVAKR